MFMVSRKITELKVVTFETDFKPNLFYQIFS